MAISESGRVGALEGREDAFLGEGEGSQGPRNLASWAGVGRANSADAGGSHRCLGPLLSVWRNGHIERNMVLWSSV